MEFFRHSVGDWRSQRTTHHLPFRRSEVGGSLIRVTILEADDPKVIEICQMHEVDPALAAGGAVVTWNGEMEWDKNDENHAGSSVMVIVPDAETPRKGQLLRERGYAEIAPVAGHYEMDDSDALNLVTEYETMSAIERFSFVSPDLRMRTSAVTRFGGFSTATFCTEMRVGTATTTPPDSPADMPTKATAQSAPAYSVLGW